MPPHREHTPGPIAVDIIYKSNQLKRHKFQGGVDPLRYDEWMWRLENPFEIMYCPARFKVALATYQFEGVAEY